MSPFLSICIPVYNSEAFVEQCLQSIVQQKTEFKFEVIVINDGSQGQNKAGLGCKKLIKKFSKENHFKIKYIEHSKNMGLVEARRSLTYESRGQFILFCDSDDLLAPNAIELLCKTAIKTDADIVQGKSQAVKEDGSSLVYLENKKDKVFAGNIFGREILKKLIVDKEFSSFMWGKLFKRELLLNAFDKIIPTYCNMAEDYLINFFNCLLAQNYYGMEETVYFYRITSGMTSHYKKITELKEWEQICSTASVFTIIYNFENENPQYGFSDLEKACVGKSCIGYLKNNIIQMEKMVSEKLKEDALELLRDYWGKKFVNHVLESKETEV